MSGLTDHHGERLPVGVLTGFLGSGKTTLLRQWLQDSPAGDCGAHQRIRGRGAGPSAGGPHRRRHGAAGQRLRLLRHTRRTQGRFVAPAPAPPARRAAAFSKGADGDHGLAAPGPVIATLIGDAQLRQIFRPAFISTVVDALHAPWQQSRRPEWLAQVAAADRLYLSKTDLATPQQAEAQRAQLAQINPGQHRHLRPWRSGTACLADAGIPCSANRLAGTRHCRRRAAAGASARARVCTQAPRRSAWNLTARWTGAFSPCG
ncbi:COBW domain-containing protein 6 [Manis javanica]|nr:COBW domain-containing protein 6 [Manis javanica]